MQSEGNQWYSTCARVVWTTINPILPRTARDFSAGVLAGQPASRLDFVSSFYRLHAFLVSPQSDLLYVYIFCHDLWVQAYWTPPKVKYDTYMRDFPNSRGCVCVLRWVEVMIADRETSTRSRLTNHSATDGAHRHKLLRKRWL